MLKEVIGQQNIEINASIGLINNLKEVIRSIEIKERLCRIATRIFFENQFFKLNHKFRAFSLWQIRTIGGENDSKNLKIFLA